MLIFAFLSLFTVFSTSSISGAEPADEYEQTCTLNLPGISASNGCAQLTGYPTSNFGPVEFMWARNTGSSIEAMTGWSTTQTLTYCPSQSGDYRICARVVGCGQIYESNDIHVQVDPCGSLTGLYIYSQSSDSPVIGPISNGQTIQSSSLPNAYYLSVQTSGAIESVILNVDGSVITENVVLYTFPGNAENGTNWTNGIGSHTVSATGYNQDNGLGQQCGNISLTFTITGGCQNVTSSGSIMANSTECSGESITIESISLPSGGSGILEYVWLFNPNSGSVSGSSAIQVNAPELTLIPTQSGWYRRCARRAGCTDYVGESNWVHVGISDCITPPSDPQCGAGSFLWTNTIDVTNLSGSAGIPQADVRLVDGTLTSFTIPGPYPAEFNGPITLSIDEAVSWDAYLTRASTGNQPNEQWRLVFFNNGQVVYSTQYTQDLATGVQSAEWVGALDQDILLPNGTDEIRIIHYENAQYGSGSSSSANSVVPVSVCISYEQNCNLSVDLGDDLNVCNLSEVELTAEVSGQSSCVSACERAVTAPVRCGNNNAFVVWLVNSGSNEFSSSNAQFIENGDGTARFTATATNGSDVVEVDITYSGRTTTAPSDSPKNNICESTITDNWVYYTQTNGTIVSQNHGTFFVSRMGPSFQLGYSAMYIAPGFGASGWLTITGGDGFYDHGDINIKLGECVDSVVNNDVSYLWSTGDTTQSITVSQSGSYSVTVTDCSGCTAADTVNITYEDEAPVFDQQQSLYDLACTESVPLITPTVSDNSDSNVTLTYTDEDNCVDPSDISCDFRTYTQGGWGSPGNGNNPGAYRDENFAATFPNGLTIGCAAGNTLTLTSAQAVKDFLPSGSTPSALPGDLVDPGNSYNNVLAGQLTALTLSLGFDAAIPSFAPSTGYLGDAVINSGPLSGTTVSQLVQISNDVIGGCSSSYSYSLLNETLTAINENFDGGANQGFITCAVEDPACACTVVRTWTAQDDCGNTSIFVQTFIKGDNEGPVPSIEPEDLTLQCNDPVPPMPDITFTDECAEVVSYCYEEMSESVGENTVITRVWSATDGCNLTIVDQVITIYPCNASLGDYVWYDLDRDGIQDENESGVEGFTVYLYSCGVTEPIDSTTTDENGFYIFEDLIPGQSYYVVFDPNDLPEGYEFSVQDAGSDDSLDSDADENGITECVELGPNEFNPTIDAGIFVCTEIEILGQPQGDLTIECDEDVPAPIQPEFFDPYDSDLDIEFTELTTTLDCGYQIVRTWDADNDCGSRTTYSYTVTVTDTTDPVVTSIPGPITIGCNDPLPSLSVSFNDNCDNMLSIAMSMSEEILDCGNKTITLTQVATDDCGNSTSADIIIYVVDSTLPSITANADATVECGETFDLAGYQAHDDCSDVNVDVDSLFTAACGNTGVWTLTYTATDACGNSASDVQTITIVDTTAPSLTVNADASVECGDSFDLAGYDASDVCGEVAVDIDSVFAAACGNTGLWTLTYTATDACGNSSVEIQTITTSDTTPPSVSANPDAEVECGEDFDLVGAQVSDLCGEVTLDIDSLFDSACGSSGRWTITYTAMDECGNSASDQQYISIEDTTPPVLVVPADAEASCDAIPSAGEASALDNCDPNVLVIYLGEVQSEGCPYTLTRTWSATDECGNSVVETQVISVFDNVAPVLTDVPDDINGQCGMVPPPAQVTAIDNCYGVLPVSFNEEITSLGCETSITRTWTAVDACGNSVSASQSITYSDTEAPTANCPSNTTVDCSQADISPEFTGWASGSDNCDEDLSIVYSDGEITGECPASFIRTWTLTDDCGNSSSCEQVITIIDEQAPILVVPADITIDCEDSTLPNNTGMASASDECSSFEVYYQDGPISGTCPYSFTRTWYAVDLCQNESSGNQVITITDETAPELTYGPESYQTECGSPIPFEDASFTDNCTTDLSISFDETSSPLDCGFEIVRTWVATDDCENSTTHTQIITVVDTTAPEFINAPLDETVECDDIPSVGTLSAQDICDTEVIVAYNGQEMSGSCPSIIVRTWTATDDCGNTSIHIQTITVIDTTAPEITGVPDDLAVDCENIPAPAIPSVTDNCDDNVQIQLNEVVQTGACPYTITRTWTATDLCGNTSVAQQVLTVTDVIAPVFDPYPVTLEIQCDEVDDYLLTVSDNCSNVELTFTDLLFSGSCIGTLERTWTATDACGNSDIAIQYLFLRDDEAPVPSEIPENITIQCDDEIPAPPQITGLDNCDDNVNVSFTETVSGQFCPYVITRTWTLEDECGNEAQVEQTITVVTSLNVQDIAMQAIPNPFDGNMTIMFALPEDGFVLLEIYNALGERLEIIYNGYALGGIQYEIKVDGSQWTDGVYYSRLLMDDISKTDRIMKSK